MRRFVLSAVCAAVGVAGSPSLAQTPPNYPTKPIELNYYMDGPWAVNQTTTPAGCDSKGNACDIFYPAGLGWNGFKHPIIAWGNGTNATPVPATTYGTLLQHLASWGFVVIATQDGETGVGETIIDSANYMVSLNADSASIFYDTLDTTRIGAAGHSQGATGAVNALLKSEGLVSTAIAFHIPKQSVCSSPENCVQTEELEAMTDGSVFYVSGTRDFLVSPDKKKKNDTDLNSNTAYYEATPSALQKVKAILKGTGHNDIQGDPTCSGASWPCYNGVYGYLGYPTAWMMWRLQDATDGHQAFLASGGEIFTETDNWQSVLSNVQ